MFNDLVVAKDGESSDKEEKQGKMEVRGEREGVVLNIQGMGGDFMKRRSFRRLERRFRRSFEPSQGGNFLDMRGRRKGIMRKKMGISSKASEGFKRGTSSFYDT